MNIQSELGLQDSKKSRDLVFCKRRIVANSSPLSAIENIKHTVSQVIVSTLKWYRRRSNSATLGIGSFHCQGDKCVMLLPMKLTYQELVPDVKMNILQAIENAGGQVEGLTGLVE